MPCKTFNRRANGVSGSMTLAKWSILTLGTLLPALGFTSSTLLIDQWTASEALIRAKVSGSDQFEQKTYEFKVSVNGSITVRTGDFNHSFDLGPGGFRNQIVEELSKICRMYGSSLRKVFTKPKMGGFRKPKTSGVYPDLIEAKCYSTEEWQAKIDHMEERLKAEEKEKEVAAALERARLESQAKQIAEQAELDKARREQNLIRQKADCTSYGFSPNTDGHARCVMDLAIAEKELEQRASVAEQQSAAKARAEASIKYDLAELRSEMDAASQAAAAESRGQNQAQALINLGAAISSGGVSSGSSNLSPTTPLSSGRYKTCRYRVAGEIFPMTMGRAELCPATRSIGGQTGYLVR